MKRWIPYPVLWAFLLAMWLALNQSLDLAHWMLGALAAYAGVRAVAALQLPQGGMKRPRAAVEFAWLVLTDIVRSNVAVGRIVLARGPVPGEHAGFLDVPLETRSPIALAALACVITSTPGTAWAGYDSERNVLTMHILDLVDEAHWLETIKGRYESRLMEIFE